MNDDPTHSPARKNSWKRWLRPAAWTLAALLTAALACAGGGVFWLRLAARAALPELEGEIVMPGLSAPVVVRRDGHGVPHIEAAAQDDLWLAQGYVTAQDRLWQMDALRRNANGELAEILGPSMAQHDLAQRVLGIRRTAQRIYDGLPAEDRHRFDLYAQGVNAFLAQHGDRLPPEFRLLHYRPRPWSGADSVSVGLILAQALDTHWPEKLARERIEARLHHDPDLIADLYPVGSWRDHPPTGEKIEWRQPQARPQPDNNDEDDDTPAEARLGVGASDLQELRQTLGLPDCAGCAPGSNNWAVAGAHTASGRPLLANDMHLGLTAPDIWCMVDLRAPGFHAAGVALPGVPYVLAGHNEHVAWGFTALYADVQDLYLEKLDGKGKFLDRDGSWKPLSITHETIKVRWGKDIAIDVQATAHGPIVTPILKREKRPIALRWTLYDPALTLPPIYRINTAATAAEFDARMSAWSYPTQNVVFADDQGHIGYHAVGRTPLRAKGLQDTPAPATGGEWRGYLPYEKAPHVFDPPSGFLATANARVSSSRFPEELTHEWPDPYRVERIYKSLQGRDGLKAADMLALQTDVYSEVDQQMGHRFAYALERAAKNDERMRKAASLMRAWDGRLTTDSAAASLVTQTRAVLWRLILAPKLGKEAENYRWAESNFAEEEIVMRANPAWLPRGYKNWDELIAAAVRRAMQEGSAPADLNQWRYGSWHVVEVAHPLTTLAPCLARFVGTGKQPLSGDATTVKQAGRTFGPSQRFVMDWSDVDGSTENIAMGESGNPASPYFGDQWRDYSAGRSFALPFTSAAVAAATRHTLRLKP